MKLDALKDKSAAQLLLVQLDNRLVEAFEFGTQTVGVLKKLQAEKNTRLTLLHTDMIQFLKRSSKYLQERLPLQNRFLFCIQCLMPLMRNNPDSIQMINTLATSVPRVACGLNFLCSVSTKWRLYQADANISLDGWNQQMAMLHQLMISQIAKQDDGLGSPKYVNLIVVVKAPLCISHVHCTS